MHHIPPFNPAPSQRPSPPDHGPRLPWRLAAPSWVWPGGVVENVARLAPEFHEIGILLLETTPTPAYRPEDFPSGLGNGTTRFHLHLPLDLPWHQGMAVVGPLVDSLFALTRGLSPWAAVLHAPPDARLLAAAAQSFAASGIPPRRILLENTEDFSYCDFYCDIKYFHYGMCLDLGHMLAHGQERCLFLPDLWSRVRMVHLCAPGPGGAHAPLTELDAEGHRLLRYILERLEPGSVVMLELFSPEALFTSQEFLALRLREWGMTP